MEQARSSSPCIELDGEPVGYAIYRIKSDWQDGFSQSQVQLVEAIATSPAATRELYRFIFGIDLVVRVQGRYDPGSPLFLMVSDPRSLHLKVSEGLWLRFVDLEAALAGRTYAGDDCRRRRRERLVLSLERRALADRQDGGADG